jgi:predicted DNA-binding protein
MRKEEGMNTFSLTESQQKRLEQVAQQLERTPAELLNGFIQEHIEELLEDLEDGIAAEAVMQRVKTGEEKTMTLDELLQLYHYQEDDGQE